MVVVVVVVVVRDGGRMIFVTKVSRRLTWGIG